MVFGVGTEQPPAGEFTACWTKPQLFEALPSGLGVRCPDDRWGRLYRNHEVVASQDQVAAGSNSFGQPGLERTPASGSDRQHRMVAELFEAGGGRDLGRAAELATDRTGRLRLGRGVLLLGWRALGSRLPRGLRGRLGLGLPPLLPPLLRLGAPSLSVVLPEIPILDIAWRLWRCVTSQPVLATHPVPVPTCHRCPRVIEFAGRLSSSPVVGGLSSDDESRRPDSLSTSGPCQPGYISREQRPGRVGAAAISKPLAWLSQVQARLP